MKVLLISISVFAAGFLFKDNMFDRVFSIPGVEIVDFGTLSLTAKPNQYLVCPKDLCAAKSHRESPTYSVSAQELERKWDALVAGAERAQVLGSGVYAMRSQFWRFPDLISVRFIAEDEKSSTLAVYSRALYGRKDFDKNKQRIDAWLEVLALP